MKKLIPFLLLSSTTVLCLSTISASASLLAPRVRADADPLAARAQAGAPDAPKCPPGGTPGVRLVTCTADSGPGSLRWAINGAAAGDTVRFDLRLPATIWLCSTLTITQTLAIVGPGPDQLTVMRGTATNAPLFRVFDVESGDVAIAGITIRNGVANDA
jgi:hypothetical protein